MKLTGNILLHTLNTSRQIHSFHGVDRCRNLQAPLIYSPGDPLLTGWVYVVDTSVSPVPLHPEQDNLLIVYTGPLVQGLRKDTPGAWIRMNPSVSATQVLNRIIRAFAIYDHWQEQLEEIQVRLGSVDEMLEVSVKIFSNPIMVLDADLTVVNWVSDGFFARDQLGFFSSGRERMHVINSMLQDPGFQESRTRSECYWGPDYLLGFRCICRNIERSGESQYCIIVIEDNTILKDAHLDLLEILGTYVQFVIYHQDRRVAGRLENLAVVLNNILTDRTFDYLEASRQLAELGWKKDDTYLCLIYQLTYLDRSVLPAVSICRYMEDQYECCSFLHSDNIVNYFNLTNEKRSEEEIQNQLKPFIRDSFLKAGFSRSIVGHMHLRHQYLQALASLDVGSRKNPYQWIHYFDNLAFDYIREQISWKLPVELIAHQGLLRLTRHDREQGTEYVKTLRAYLDCSQNAVHAAKQLYIHRSTFLYRMDKIREILDCDLTDADDVLYLNLSMRLLDTII